MAGPLKDEEIEQEEPEAEPEEVVEPVEEEEPEEEPEPEEPGEEPEPPMSRRKALRIQNLLTKLTGEESPRSSNPRTTGSLDYKTALEADEATVKALEDDRRKYGEQSYNQGVEQAKTIQFHTRLEIDTPKVQAKYAQFDPESSSFNPVATDAINRMYLSTVGYDSRTDSVKSSAIRYSDYVESLMELADEMAGQKVAKSAKRIAKQAAQTGIRPGGSTPKRMNLNQPAGAMSDAELDAVIAMGIPKR